MSASVFPSLQESTSPRAVVACQGNAARLEIPASPAGGRHPPYAIAQLDDYHGLPRRRFRWQPPVTLNLRARVSQENLPGTWGFGLWNDPFSFSVGLGGATQRLPALPNAAWFFYASPPNYLSFRDDLPAQGFLAATFRSPLLPAALLALATPALGLGMWSPTARLLRRILRGFIRQAASQVDVAVTVWHEYRLLWQAGRVAFSVDGEMIFATEVSPRGPLALVLWMDNQFAALPPRGRLTLGTLPLPQAGWLEIEQLEITG